MFPYKSRGRSGMHLTTTHFFKRADIESFLFNSNRTKWVMFQIQHKKKKTNGNIMYTFLLNLHIKMNFFFSSGKFKHININHK